MSYQSPIEAIYNDIEHNFEDAVFKAIQKVGIKVDRNELIKALEYDRAQYDKGYSDGRFDRDREIVRCKDCKHHEDEDLKTVYCPNIVGGWVDYDFYCRDGKEKSNEEG